MGKGDKDLGVEYLNAKELRNFLLFRQKVHNGVLQAWVNQGTAKVMSPNPRSGVYGERKDRPLATSLWK